MTRWVLLVTFRPDAPAPQVERWCAAANDLAEQADTVEASSVAPSLPGSVGGCDAPWDLAVAGGASPDDIPALAALTVSGGSNPVAAVDRLALDPVAAGFQPIDGERIKRTLALRVRPGTAAAEVARFERSLQAMPEHIAAIRSWSLSRVRHPESSGGWTHVWEQEFEDENGLRNDYLRHPYHWTGVERWFDPEIPGSIVDPRLLHVFRLATGPVLTAAGLAS